MQTPSHRWKAAREAAGLSAQQAAALLKVHRNTVYDLENPDKDGHTLRLMKRAAATYGVTLGEIFRDDADAETIPRELRPLSDLLRPLTYEDREAIVRNITANLSFMGRLYGPQVVEKRGVAEVRSNVRSTTTENESFVPGLTEPEDSESPTAHNAKTRRKTEGGARP